MEKSSAPGSSFEELKDSTPPGGKPVAGDADAVQKTTYVVGQGTNPNASDHDAEATTGETPAGEATPLMPRGTGDAPP